MTKYNIGDILCMTIDEYKYHMIIEHIDPPTKLEIGRYHVRYLQDNTRRVYSVTSIDRMDNVLLVA
jgi:hypothetical protein